MNKTMEDNSMQSYLEATMEAAKEQIQHTMDEKPSEVIEHLEKNKAEALYMKSGLYITEIVKRLYNSAAMKAAIPDDRIRVRHILQKQVYGMAPTRIIYLIATNYILGFDETLKSESHNFVEADAAEASKNGTLADLVNKSFR